MSFSVNLSWPTSIQDHSENVELVLKIEILEVAYGLLHTCLATWKIRLCTWIQISGAEHILTVI